MPELSDFLHMLKRERRFKSALSFSVSKKPMAFCTLQIRHIFCENKFSRKISLRSSKSLMAQAFLMAIIQLEASLFSLRLGHGAALTCHRHVIHSRAAASLPLKLPRCAVVFTQQHRFLTVSKERRFKSALSFFLAFACISSVHLGKINAPPKSRRRSREPVRL